MVEANNTMCYLSYCFCVVNVMQQRRGRVQTETKMQPLKALSTWSDWSHQHGIPAASIFVCGPLSHLHITSQFSQVIHYSFSGVYFLFHISVRNFVDCENSRSLLHPARNSTRAEREEGHLFSQGVKF